MCFWTLQEEYAGYDFENRLHVLSPTAPEERDKQHALEDGDHL